MSCTYLPFCPFDFYVMHAGVGNLVNAILDAIFVFPLGLGVRGAALATVTSEYVKPSRELNALRSLVSCSSSF